MKYKTAEEFNKHHPVGAPVFIQYPNGDTIKTVTVEEAKDSVEMANPDVHLHESYVRTRNGGYPQLQHVTSLHAPGFDREPLSQLLAPIQQFRETHRDLVPVGFSKIIVDDEPAKIDCFLPGTPAFPIGLRFFAEAGLVMVDLIKINFPILDAPVDANAFDVNTSPLWASDLPYRGEYPRFISLPESRCAVVGVECPLSIRVRKAASFSEPIVALGYVVFQLPPPFGETQQFFGGMPQQTTWPPGRPGGPFGHR